MNFNNEAFKEHVKGELISLWNDCVDKFMDGIFKKFLLSEEGGNTSIETFIDKMVDKMF